MIILRKLMNKDIPYMIEWMHDTDTRVFFQKNFLNTSEEDVKEFIACSFTNENRHFAIVDEDMDEYLGTISLKNIDYVNKNAEYAIATRKVSRGKGINYAATEFLMRYAFEELKLHKIYLNVLETNEKAISLYRKIGFIYEGKFREHVIINNQYINLLWYSITVNDRIE